MRIFLLCKEAILRMYLVEILEARGHVVLAAETARALPRPGREDILLARHHVLREDELRLLEDFREEDGRCRAVVCSSGLEEADRERLRAHGVDFTLEMPILEWQLVEMLEECSSGEECQAV